jgi:hypothetical protein
MFKSGCGVAILLLSGAAVGLGLLMGGECGGDPRATDSTGRTVAVRVGDQPVYAEDVIEQAQEQMRNMPVDPKTEAYVYSMVLSGQIQRAANVQLAQRSGVQLTDDAIMTGVDRQLNDVFGEGLRFQLLAQSKIGADATPEQVAEAYKAETGKTPDEERQEIAQEVRQGLADPARRADIISAVAPELVMGQFRESRNPSEQEVRQSFDMLNFRRILISTRGKTAQEAQAEAEKVLQEVRGGTDFKQAMDRHSQDVPQQEGKVSENTVSLARIDLEANPTMQPLMQLEPNGISGVIDVPEGKAIYQLIDVKSDAPADFDEQKDRYRREYLDRFARQRLQREIEQITKGGGFDWQLKGFKALYDFGMVMTEATPGDQATRMRAIADEAKAAADSNNFAEQRVALVTWYAAVDELWTQATDKQPLRAERKDVLEAILQNMESFEARMKLVEVAIEENDGSAAFLNLNQAARTNVTYDPTAEQRWREVNERIEQLKAQNLLTDEQESGLREVQERWRTEKAEAERIEQEIRAQQEAEQRRLQEEFEKQEREAAAATTGGAGTTPAPSTTGGAPAPATTGQ